jgi:hypothetical protein
MINKVKYSCYTADSRLKVRGYAEKHGNKLAGHEFTLSGFNVFCWRKQKDYQEIQGTISKAERCITS